MLSKLLCKLTKALRKAIFFRIQVIWASQLLDRIEASRSSQAAGPKALLTVAYSVKIHKGPFVNEPAKALSRKKVFGWVRCGKIGSWGNIHLFALPNRTGFLFLLFSGDASLAVHVHEAFDIQWSLIYRVWMDLLIVTGRETHAPID